MSVEIQKGSGCSAARLAHHVRDVGVGSSNLLTPTKAESLSGGAGRAFLFRSKPNAQRLSARRNKKALPDRFSDRERLSAFDLPPKKITEGNLHPTPSLQRFAPLKQRTTLLLLLTPTLKSLFGRLRAQFNS